ncbi:MAG: M56 family metallopeptidase, partial [Firmicutes bacterium]|nr:M56 family metallopeptidase [Bacillota bacterium]
MTDLIRAVLIMTLTGTALTLLLFALKPLLRDRLPKSAQYYLWLAVLAALLTPVSKLVVLPANNPISNAPLQSIVAQLPIPTAAAARPQAPLGNAGSADSAVTTAPSASSAETAQPKSTPLDLILVLVYAAGALITLLYYVVNYKIYIGLHRRRNRPARAEELSILAVLCRHRRRVPRLYRNPLAATPMLVGLLRPAILLPDRDYTEAQLRAVLCHELCHLRRKDVLIRWISVFAVAVHWFNPL